MTISRAQVYRSLRSRVFLKLTADQVLVSDWIAGSCQVNLLKTGQDCPEIVRRPVNASLGSKFIRIVTFSSIQMFFSLLFCFEYMMIIKLKTESQTVNRTPHRKVTTLKSTFYIFLGKRLNRALNNPAKELRF